MTITKDDYQELNRLLRRIDEGGNDGADIEEYNAYKQALELEYDKLLHELIADYKKENQQ